MVEIQFKPLNWAVFGAIKEVSLWLMAYLVVMFLASALVPAYAVLVASFLAIMFVLYLAIYGVVKWLVIGWLYTSTPIGNWFGPCPSIAALFALDLVAWTALGLVFPILLVVPVIIVILALVSIVLSLIVTNALKMPIGV